MGNYEAWSKDGKYGLRVPSRIMKKMQHLCKKANNVEVGGILVGYYNRRHDCAIVTNCSGPPRDSECGKSFFYRGIQDLQHWLIRSWNLRQRRYYLGEWHFHPSANPTPSSVDMKQMKSNAESKSYRCPEPVLFVIGGNPDKNYACVSFVYIKERGMIELYKQWENRRTSHSCCSKEGQAGSKKENT